VFGAAGETAHIAGCRVSILVRDPPAIAIVLGVVALLFVSNASGAPITESHSGGLTSERLLDSGVNTTRVCASLGPDPGAESSGPTTYKASAFWDELCANETFGERLTAWGGWEWSYWILPNGQSGNYSAAQNLSTSLVPQPNSSSLRVVYLLDWVAPCDNSTLGPNGTYCNVWDQWIGNTTTLALSGPQTNETPTRWSSCVNVASPMVTFLETGLPSGTTWQVYLNGTWWPVEAQGQSFGLPHGKYYFEIGTVPGYSVNPTTGDFYTYGPIGVTIHFTLLPPSGGQPTPVLGVTFGTLVVLVAVILALAAGVSGSVWSRRRRVDNSRRSDLHR
jgi:hypothetical protein